MTAKLFVTNGLATSVFTYDPATLALDTETITYTIPGQAAFTRVLDRSRDTLGRDTGYTLGTPSPSLAVETQATYGYSPTHGRLQTVAGASSGSFTYTYLPKSNLLASVTGPAHTTTNTYEANRDILASKQNKAGAIIVSNYDYTVNEIGQRSGLSQSGSAFASTRSTAWAYDSLGQVTRADSSLPGLDRAYQFDMSGNRLKTADSLTLPASNNYTANALNQYIAVEQGSVGVSPAYDDDGNMTSGSIHARRLSVIGMRRREAVLAWSARSSMMPRSRSMADQSSRLSSAMRIPENAPTARMGMRWGGAAWRSFAISTGVKTDTSSCLIFTFLICSGAVICSAGRQFWVRA